MPKIHAHNNLTGQVGSVVFLHGVGETDDERMLAYFSENAHAFTIDGNEPADVEALRQAAEQAEADKLAAEAAAAGEPRIHEQDCELIAGHEGDCDSSQACTPIDLGQNAPADDKPAKWDDLTDEQLDEAYATNVPDGAATTRKGKLKALHALDA